MPTRASSKVKTRLLLLAANSTFQQALAAALRSDNCEIILAAGCRQALDLARSLQVDVLVVDFDLHGREFSRLAPQSGFEEGHCPTLILTGSLEQLTFSYEAGTDGALMKPIDPSQLRTVIQNLLAGARAPALTGKWPPDAVLFPETARSRRDWRINE